MGVRKLVRAGLTAAAAVALGALPAAAQTVTYSTTGSFSGGGCTATSCVVGGFTLSFLNAPSTSYVAPTLVDLGQFNVLATEPTQPVTPFPAGIQFTLTINQTAPSAGSSAFVGSISGSMQYNPSSSSLVWTPTTSSTTIGFAQYTLVRDQAGNIAIQAPTTNGGNPNPTSVKANVSVTPEPATLLLLAPGLAGMGLVARRRKNK
jgi:hypothetical protein